MCYNAELTNPSELYTVFRPYYFWLIAKCSPSPTPLKQYFCHCGCRSRRPYTHGLDHDVACTDVLPGIVRRTRSAGSVIFNNRFENLLFSRIYIPHIPYIPYERHSGTYYPTALWKYSWALVLNIGLLHYIFYCLNFPSLKSFFQTEPPGNSYASKDSGFICEL